MNAECTGRGSSTVFSTFVVFMHCVICLLILSIVWFDIGTRTWNYKVQYVTVPAGHCWVEGDHHGQSMDSNLFGPVSKLCCDLQVYIVM